MQIMDSKSCVRYSNRSHNDDIWALPKLWLIKLKSHGVSGCVPSWSQDKQTIPQICVSMITWLVKSSDLWHLYCRWADRATMLPYPCISSTPGAARNWARQRKVCQKMCRNTKCVHAFQSCPKLVCHNCRNLPYQNLPHGSLCEHSLDVECCNACAQ